MTEFVGDYAAADLTTIEEGVLRGLASLGYNPTVADLAEFAAGFAHVEQVDPRGVRIILATLDSLGWASPVDDDPLTSDTWYVTTQGRVALERQP